MDSPSFPNWFANVAGFFEILPKDTPLRALQIGTYTGDATEWLLNNRTIERLYDVDTWEGSQEQAHDELDFSEVEKYYDQRFSDSRITKFKMTSDEFFVQNKDTFNFIYVDGDHTALQVGIDGLNAFRALEKDGIIAFDDYGWHHQGSAFLEPQRGIDAILSICQGEYRVLQHGYQVWIQKI